MPRFRATVPITESIVGVSLQVPFPAGPLTTVSEDEAAILRALPEQWAEVLPDPPPAWSPTPQQNRMVAGAEVVKAAGETDAGCSEE